MKDPIVSLRRQLRWTQAVLGLGVAALCLAATPATRTLILDASNHPTSNVDFGSSHWTGDPTSGKAISPAGITTARIVSSDTPAITLSLTLGATGLFYGSTGISFTPSGATLSAYGPLNITTATTVDGNLTAAGAISFDAGAGSSDGAGDLTANNVSAGQTLASIEVDVNDPNNAQAGGAFTYSAAGGFRLGTAGPASGASSSLSVGGTVQAASLGLFGVTPPASRPATPTTQAGIIAVLQAYGLCQ